MPGAAQSSADDRSTTPEEEEEENIGDGNTETSHRCQKRIKKTGSQEKKEKTVFKKVGKTLPRTKQTGQVMRSDKSRPKTKTKESSDSDSGSSRKRTGCLNRKAFSTAKLCLEKKKKERSVCSVLKQFLSVLEKVNW